MSVCRYGFWDLINNFYRTYRWYFFIALVFRLVSGAKSSRQSVFNWRFCSIQPMEYDLFDKKNKTSKSIKNEGSPFNMRMMPRKTPEKMSKCIFLTLSIGFLSLLLKFLIFNAKNKTNQPHRSCAICARVSRMRIKYESFSASFNALQNV